MSSGPRLVDRVPAQADPDTLLEAFVDWTIDAGFELYPAQEEAVLELMSGRHLILNTPTGSGKSMVANAAHFATLAAGERSYYTSPIKALVSEKFFDLCELFGAERVGMLTGDASINHDAPIICCTAEVLANIALQEGATADVHNVVMDEFHYFSDRERGVAWQVPLLRLPQTRFVLMSATLGDTRRFEAQIPAATGRELAVVRSSERPVPLAFAYAETTLHESIEKLVDQNRAPVYVVNFTQREAAELAQDLVSLALVDRAQRDEIKAEMSTFRFTSHYGKDLKRFLSAGVGLHHAGLLPKYRRLVERLSQKGLLKVVCGTDTLGVGVNIPLRSVLFSKLCKYDGESTKILSVRDFKQIAGRAGRKGYDDKGWVVAQAPAHVVENLKLERKAAASGKKKFTRKKAPDRGYVHWDDKTFEKLQSGDPEPLTSQFQVTTGMILDLMQSPAASGARRGAYGALVDMIAESYESPGRQSRHRRHAATLFRALRDAGVLRLVPREGTRGQRVQVDPDLDDDFSLFHALSLWLVEAASELDVADENYALHLLSLVEAILENPRALLHARERLEKSELIARMKAEGADYDARTEALEKVSYPKPLAEYIYASFDAFRATHPWIRSENIRPKGLAREMYESFSTFDAYVRKLGIARAEGLLLRYLNEVFKTLRQSLPERCKTDAVLELTAWLGATIERVDASLVSEWERLVDTVSAMGVHVEVEAPQAPNLRQDTRALRARARAEVHRIVAAIAGGDFDEAAASFYAAPESSADAVTDTELQSALQAVVGDSAIVFDHRARLAEHTRLRELADGVWELSQALFDTDAERAEAAMGPPDEQTDAAREPSALLVVTIDLRDDPTPVGPMLRWGEITTA